MSELKQVRGKKIKRATWERTEASDGCEFGELTIYLTDGSEFGIRVTPVLPTLENFYWRNDDDDKPATRAVR